jgi:hypothetical protein
MKIYEKKWFKWVKNVMKNDIVEEKELWGN